MTTNGKDDDVVVRDASGRRRFIRTGTAVLLAGAAGARGREALAADCDRAVYREDGKNPKQAASGSDSDTGAGADPAGCGRRRDDPPAISKAAPADGLPRVAKVRG